MGAYLDTIGALSYTAAVVKQIKDQYSSRKRNKTVSRLLRRADTAYQQAIECWRAPTNKEIARLGRVISRLGGNTIDQDNHPSVYTQFSLVLVEELLDHINHKERKRAVENLHAAILALHKYFDRNLSRTTEADIALDAADEWKRLAAQV